MIDRCLGIHYLTICYNCYQALRVPTRTQNSKHDNESLGHKSPVLTASSLGFPDTLVISPKPVFTVPPWRHLQSLEGYGSFDVVPGDLAETLTRFNIPFPSNREIELVLENDTRITGRLGKHPQGVSTNHQAGRITRRTGRQENLDQWDEREIEWLESFLKVITWMEAQGLRA